MAIWTHNICKKCWLDKYGYRIPARMVYPDKELVAFVARKNQDGIYTAKIQLKLNSANAAKSKILDAIMKSCIIINVWHHARILFSPHLQSNCIGRNALFLPYAETPRWCQTHQR